MAHFPDLKAGSSYSGHRDWQAVHITAKELVPVVVAAALWGRHWSRQCIHFKCDNMAVVHLLKTRVLKDKLVVHLLRCLSFYSAMYRFQFIAEHLPGAAADAISRNNIHFFFSLVPQSQQVSIPLPVLNLLVTSRPDWGSQAWTRLFLASLSRESPKQPELHTSQAGGST